MQMKSGSQGFSGKKAVNALTMFDQLFTIESSDTSNIDEDDIEDSDELMTEALDN
jgi:hypothetical protein